MIKECFENRKGGEAGEVSRVALVTALFAEPASGKKKRAETSGLSQ
jgi:hypothetical protein